MIYKIQNKLIQSIVCVSKNVIDPRDNALKYCLASTFLRCYLSIVGFSKQIEPTRSFFFVFKNNCSQKQTFAICWKQFILAHSSFLNNSPFTNSICKLSSLIQVPKHVKRAGRENIRTKEGRYGGTKCIVFLRANTFDAWTFWDGQMPRISQGVGWCTWIDLYNLWVSIRLLSELECIFHFTNVDLIRPS